MPFLQLVARDLLQRYADDMHNVTVVLPSKRAGLFLNRYLYAEAGHAVWTPAYCTIDELFTSLSPYAPIDTLEAICLLYKVYSECLPDTVETLDHFYSWGEVLLADFDDIDKHLVRADLLFSNIEDLALLTSTNYLTDEQEQTLRRFFKTFDRATDESLREKFRQMWRAMPSIYHRFNDEMHRLGRMTEGALYRDVAQHLAEYNDTRTYAFVGLNALTTVEEQLLLHLKAEGRATFYFDYADNLMHEGHEAAFFMMRNLKLFGRVPLPQTSLYEPQYTYVSVAGSNVQARYIPQWMSDIQYAEHHRDEIDAKRADTAIVLCDETLLEGVLHALPDTERSIYLNITMGFPLVSTPVYGMVKALLAMHTDGWNRDAQRPRSYERRIVSLHPLLREAVSQGLVTFDKHEEGSLWLVQYIKEVTEIVARIENDAERSAREANEEGDVKEEETKSSAETILLQESLLRVRMLMNNIEQLIAAGTLQVETPRLRSIIESEMKRMSIPFHGEPAQGLQVIGMLETRSLDFDNILMLSVGEGNMPKGDKMPSFIPYTLRKPFGLTTVEHRVAIQAYNFYRLLQRAKSVTFVYDTANADGVKNEMSRFLRQMLVEMRQNTPNLQPPTSFPDQAIALKPTITLPTKNQLVAAKTPQVVDYLLSHTPFSPTALETYIQCPLKYYLHYIAKVREYDEMGDEMDAATFGTIFHDSAEELYECDAVRVTNKGRLTSKYLRHLLHTVEGEAELQRVVDKHFSHLYFEKRHIPFDLSNGALSIRRDVIVGYLKTLLRYDLRTLEGCTRHVFDCERETSYSIDLPNGKKVDVRVKIDRIDIVTYPDGTRRLQIIDYKTMSRGLARPPLNLTLDDVMAQTSKYVRHIFQTFIYSLCVLDHDYFRDAQSRAYERKKQMAALPTIVVADGVPPHIQPCVFYTQDAATDGYTTDINFMGGILYDFNAQIAEAFRERLRLLVAEILDPDKPFTCTDKSENCAYCPFATICRK